MSRGVIGRDGFPTTDKGRKSPIDGPSLPPIAWKFTPQLIPGNNFTSPHRL